MQDTLKFVKTRAYKVVAVVQIVMHKEWILAFRAVQYGLTTGVAESRETSQPRWAIVSPSRPPSPPKERQQQQQQQLNMPTQAQA